MLNQRDGRRFALLAGFALLSASVAFVASPADAADEKKPTRKDSSARIRPKQAVLTASVSPETARPGKTVTYSVTAKLDDSWHIYKYSKKQLEDGPRLTQFDFFDTAGLTTQGDWTASEDPIRKKEPAFPDIPFLEYFEEEVTWSIKLKVPAKSEPGKKTLRCQAGYMICSDENCSIPGQWTLPEVELTILPGPSSSLLPPTNLGIAAALTILAQDAPAEPTKPKAKDSRIQSKQVTFTTEISPAKAKAGETVTLKVTARINASWHIYKFSATQPEDGPKLTSFDLFDPAGLVPKGEEWTPSREPIKKKDSAFADIPFLEFYEDEVSWSLPLEVPSGTAPGTKSVGVQVGYMLCTDTNCTPPTRTTPPPAEVEIVEGDSPVPAVTQAAPTEEAKPKLKDSRIKTKPTTFSTEITPAKAKPGETVTLTVKAKIDAPWHIYKFTNDPPANGPKFTSFDLFDPAGLVAKGEEWTPSRPPLKKKDEAFQNLPFLEFYEDEVSWSLPLEIPAGTSPGSKSVRAQISYMICTNASCSLPTRLTLPAAEIEVLEGGPVAAAPVPLTEASPSNPNPAPTNTKAPVVASVPVPETDVTQKSDSNGESSDSATGTAPEDGFLAFLLFCAGGGLFALAMPCVWPMIPVTVNFFVKQGQKKNGSTTGLAITYCLSIIGIFMAIGLLFSITFGAASLSKLANNPWLNLGVAALFLVFGLSLLGLFEISLPSFMLNASAKGEGKGGLIGVMFMALTLTITSFTCTFPVVGVLLVMAAKGQLLYPVIGLATFASVLAFPFFLLALSPGLLAKMPKSGDWMNTVKVVGGLIEIGAAFKFLNTAETYFVVPNEAWFNAYTVLTLWVVLALICGIYLLGLFRTDHDYEDVKVGPGRMIGGWLFLSLALFLAPALFGRPPQNKIWYLVVGLLPADAGELKAPECIGGSGGGEMLAKPATSNDPKQAEREQTAFHGVAWGMSYEGALERAKAENRPVLIDFTGVNCANCRLMEQEVLPRPEVVDLLKKFVTIQLYTDTVPIKSIRQEDRIELAEKNIDLEARLFDEVTNPNYVALDGEGKVLGKLGGKVSPEVFSAFLKGALDRHLEGGKVAQLGSGR
ncbi:protein-disulfide reductase DsbD family protein [Tundrisphaera lichenicola]|uniref:protein-disulfide reductase DsbD family protein n=1 Tax=Tundrisphaera lichenicola TaxID=2029860 RepID=UPI003EBC2DB6